MIDEKEIFNLWQQEQAYLKEQSQQHPELFVKQTPLSAQEQLSRVGITLPFNELIPGFIKYYPFDFIVEEVQKSGSVVSVEGQHELPPPDPAAPFTTADLVKIGISTMDAIKQLSRNLKIKETQIGYGGIKDAIALTAQRISLSGSSLEKIQNLPESNYFLANVSSGKEPISISNTLGNRFTIFIRTPDPISPEVLSSRLAVLESDGFWNFYGTQRFGNRLLSHYWGSLLLQGKEEKLIRSYLSDPGPSELPFFTHVRNQANQQFGNWDAIIKLYEPLKFTFRYELQLLNYLREFRHDYVGALRTIPEQVKLWVYAYGSFMSNKVLSFMAAGDLPSQSQLPLFLSPNAQDQAVYQSFLEMDKIPKDFSQNLRRFDFIRFSSNTIQTKILPKILNYKIVPEGLIISFDLPKGVYATTFLSQIFVLESANLQMVKSTRYDLKEVLGSGSTAAVIKKFEPFIVKREVPPEE